MKKYLLGAAILTATGFTPIIPSEMEFQFAYQAPDCVVVATSTCPTWDKDGSGNFSVAVFADRNGNKVEIQIPNTTYKRMTEPGGFDHNPKKSEFISVFESLTPVADAAIAFNAVDSGETTAAAASVSWAHDVGAGADRILVVSARALNADEISSATYNGDAMTLGVKEFRIGTSGHMRYFWYIKNPDSGSNNVTLNRTGTGNIGGRAISFTGALQTGGVDSASVQENASGDRTVTVNVSTADSWLVTTYSSADAEATAAYQGTVRYGVFPSGSEIADSNAGVATGNQTIGFTWGVSDRHVILGIAFAPAGDAATFAPWQMFPW